MKVRQLALCLAAAVVLGCTPAAGEEGPGRAGELVPKFAPKGQEDLLNFINEVIAEMKANGEMERIYQEACTLAIDQIGDE